jgi:hypothetical protein
MSGETLDQSLVNAREALLDALDALEEHVDSAVLIGSQAIYLHTGGVVTGVALATKDADVMLVPPIAKDPAIERAMRDGGFTPGAQPGVWLSGDDEREVDLLVPATFDPHPTRRAARLDGHARTVARLVPGIEGAMADNDVRLIAALGAGDQRRAHVRVAGPASLLVSKAYKLADRVNDGRPGRLFTKDAHDAYRLLRLPVEELDRGFKRMAAHDLAQPVAERGITLIAELFGDAEAPGALLAGEHVVGVGDPDVVRQSVPLLANELLARLEDPPRGPR